MADWTLDALINGDVAAVMQRAVDDPAYVTGRDRFGTTPLHHAIDFGLVELVAFLLERGADPDARAGDGYTCLLSAVDSENPASLEIISMLLATGADVHRSGVNGWTALHMAAARGYVEKARILLDAGAPIDARGEIDGCETPLMQAAAQGRAETVRLLLEHGADPSMRDIVMQRTALDVARLHAKGADPDIYAHLQSDENRISVDDMLAAIPEGIFSPEDIARIRSDMKDFDAAETYGQAADTTALEGDFPETIRLLADAVLSRAQPPNGNS